MSQPSAPDTIELSTDDLPERDRWPIWYEVFGRKIVKLQMGVANSRPFRQTIRSRDFDGLTIVHGTTSGLLSRRTRALVSDGNDDFLFVAILSGHSLCSQVGRELKLDTGEATFLCNAEVGFQDFLDPAHWLCIRVPRPSLAALVPSPEDCLTRRMPAQTEALRWLTDYALMVAGTHEFATPRLRGLVATHVQDLLAVVVGGTREAVEIAKGRGMRAARLNAIKASIAENLGRAGLSLEAVAARQGISPRYVRKLLEGEGTSFSEFVLAQRLLRARRILTDPRMADRTIASIAYEVGFGDLSYFNRTFRRHYGASPSEVREEARRNGGW
jgi:AraC-like DNA-binding protein